MTFWKNVKDKAVLGRLEEEALYAVALDQLETGERRRGLWAKALVEASGDQPKAEATYLQLLVAALRDELYVAGRLQDSSADQQYKRIVRDGSTHGTPSDTKASMLQYSANSVINGYADFKACETLITAAGGTVKAYGFIFGKQYIVTHHGQTTHLNRFEDLLSWVKQNLPLPSWSSNS